MLLSSAGILILLCIIPVVFRRYRRKSLKFLPGPPSPSVLLGHDWTLLNQPEVALLERKWVKEYGTTFRIATCYSQDALMVADPRALLHIFHGSAYRYRRAQDAIENIKGLFGNGIVTVQGADHQRHRKIMNPAFAAGQIRTLLPVFQRVAKKITAKWTEELQSGKGSGVINVMRWFPNLTLDVLGDSVFEFDFGALDNRENPLSTKLRHLFDDSRRPTQTRILYKYTRVRLPAIFRIDKLFPTREDIRWKNWLDTSKGIARDLYKSKMEGQSSADNDLMGVLSRSLVADKPDKRLDMDEALSQMATIIFAGHETTASTLTWLFYELARHPQDQQKIREEIKQLREQSNGHELTAGELESMPYLNAVIKEAMRLHPVAITIMREAEADDVIPLEHPVQSVSGEKIFEIPVPKDTRIQIPVTIYNRLKHVWGEDADEWNPSRFLGNRQSTIGVYANLMTFGAGVRACIGWRFSVLEIQAVLVELLESFEFSVPEGVEIIEAQMGMVGALVRGKESEGPQMPLEIKVRA